MKYILMFLIIFLFSLSLIIPNSLFAKGKGTKKGGMVPYAKENFTTIRGSVESIDTILNKVKHEEGLHLKVKTNSGKYIVHVCPQWYADKQKIEFNKGELLTISGSRFIKDNEQNIYAATIVRASGTLKLREQNTGEYLWSGRYKNDDEILQNRQKQ